MRNVKKLSNSGSQILKTFFEFDQILKRIKPRLQFISLKNFMEKNCLEKERILRLCPSHHSTHQIDLSSPPLSNILNKVVSSRKKISLTKGCKDERCPSLHRLTFLLQSFTLCNLVPNCKIWQCISFIPVSWVHIMVYKNEMR